MESFLSESLMDNQGRPGNSCWNSCLHVCVVDRNVAVDLVEFCARSFCHSVCEQDN